jgi:hypothetical protein
VQASGDRLAASDTRTCVCVVGREGSQTILERTGIGARSSAASSGRVRPIMRTWSLAILVAEDLDLDHGQSKNNRA